MTPQIFICYCREAERLSLHRPPRAMARTKGDRASYATLMAVLAVAGGFR